MATKTSPAKKPAKKKRVKAGTSAKLSAERRQKFIETFIANGGNGKRAAIEAGFAEKGAEVTASKLLREPKVAEAIAQRAEIVAKKYELTTELAARTIYQELVFDPAKLYREDGSLKDVTELDEDTRMALVSVEFEQIGGKDCPVTVRKVKWAARHQAREQLMKHLGMFEAHNKQKSPLDGVPREMLQAIVERLGGGG